MSSLRWAIPGFVLGLVVAIGPACGPIGGEKCDARSCQGCCTTDGRCELGTQANACGVGASACQTCGPNDHCSGGICTPLIFGGNDGGNTGTDAGTGDGGMNEDGGMGDGGMGDGGVTCGPGNCSTCCINGQCVAQVNNLTCGQGGNACQTCTGSQTCTNGSCISTSCSGCVTGAGTCLTTAQQSASQCGTGGTTCTACPSGATCQNGTCVGGTTCNAQSCPNGCCSGNTCLPGTSQANCGAGGAACGSCSGSQTCQSTGNGGVCQTTTTNATVGSPCTATSQCPSGTTCRTMTSTGNATYPGGYCTKTCTTTSDCPANSDCIGGGSFGEANICAAFCNVGGYVCRTPGYTCYPIGSGDVCWLDPLPTNTTTAPAGLMGSACTQNTSCQASGAFPAGECIPATDPSSGSSTGWTSGYCTADCTTNAALCGSTATCVGFNSQQGQVGLCLGNCNNPGGGQSNCRSGYVCEDAGGQGICFPNCNNPNRGCGTGQTCQSNGYCQ